MLIGAVNAENNSINKVTSQLDGSGVIPDAVRIYKAADINWVIIGDEIMEKVIS